MSIRYPKQLVHILNLGRMGFMSAYDVQQRYAQFHLDEMAQKPAAEGHNVLLLVEHNPVYTVGLRQSDFPKIEELKLRDLGAEFFHTNRGGLITFHGPGQLVAYPILNLKKFHLGMRDYVCQLEKTMIKTCASLNITARTTEHTGVWVEDRKIGAIGIKGSRFVTKHGVSLNCNVDLGWFDHIVPCGIEGKTVTSLSKELDKEVNVHDTIPYFLNSFREQFNCDIDTTYLLQEDFDLLPTKENLKKIQKLKAAH